MLKSLWSYSLLTILVATATAQQYTVTDLGTLPGGNSSVAYNLNKNGQVAGNSNLPGNAYGHALIFQNGGLTDLGTLTGTWSVAFQVNASGQAVGYAPLADGTDRAFIFSNGQMTALPTLGGAFSDGYAINNFGQVVGASGTSDGDTHPFLFSNGTMTDLGTLGSHGSMFWNTALGINNRGQVVGYSYDANGNFFGFLWSNGKMHKIGTLGGLWSEAWDINDSSQVTGSAYTKGDLGTHAFLFSKGKMIDIDGRGATSSSIGWAINNHGVVVGRFDVPNGYRAFISSGKLQDLNTMIPANSGWILEEARGINDAGQISGYGFHNGKERGFLLTPVK